MSIRFSQSILLMFCLLLASCTSAGTNVAKTRDSLWDRVIDTGVIRAGYVSYPPFCIKDPNTGKLSGICVDIMEEAGKHLGLKVDWTEEVGWSTATEGLRANRYDVMGAFLWTNSDRGRVIDFSHPLYYSGISAYVRNNEKKITNTKMIDSADVKISTIDGETGDFIARSLFPKAKKVSLPQLSDLSQAIQNVVQNKADVVFIEAAIAKQYIKDHPNSIKNISGNKPLAVYGNAACFKKGESEFKSMLDNTFDELINMGVVDKIINKYEPTPNVVLRVALPYKYENQQ